MKRTQIQLPDRLYDRLKALAAQEETSLADVIRRAAEYLLRLHPEESTASWDIPEPESLGPFLSGDEDWRLQANEGGEI